MNEITLQWIQFSKLILLAIIAALYAFGGIHGKWKRRYVASGLLVLGFITYSLIANNFSWWILLCYPLYVGALSLGYGSDTMLKKLIKRAYCGAAIALASLPLAIAVGSMAMWYGQLVLMTGMMVWLGAFNPTPSARNEESLLGVFCGLLPLFFI